MCQKGQSSKSPFTIYSWPKPNLAINIDIHETWNNINTTILNFGKI